MVCKFFQHSMDGLNFETLVNKVTPDNEKQFSKYRQIIQDFILRKLVFNSIFTIH